MNEDDAAPAPTAHEDRVNRLLASALNDRETESQDPTTCTEGPGIPNEIARTLALSPAEAEVHRLAKRPSIGHLPSGTAESNDGGGGGRRALFGPGDRIVVERCSSFILGAWLDTRVLLVEDVNGTTGVVRCRDQELDQLTYVSFTSPLHDVRLCPAKGDPFRAPRPEQATTPALPAPEGEKRRRGRPKGSKNRPKEVIERERLERGARKGKRGKKR